MNQFPAHGHLLDIDHLDGSAKPQREPVFWPLTHYLAVSIRLGGRAAAAP
ncbi:MAG: hypothetical protein WAN44_14995 [Propionibacteriaceae bacterium]|jgi:hypothetical protein